MADSPRESSASGRAAEKCSNGHDAGKIAVTRDYYSAVASRPGRLESLMSLPPVDTGTRAALADPLDRYHAWLLQGLLGFVGVFQPLALGLAWWRTGGLLDVGSVAIPAFNAVLAWACLLGVRLGRPRLAAAAYVALGTLLLGLAYWHWGLAAQASQQALQLLPVLAAGLALGRASLWLAAAGMVAAVLAGAWRDASLLLFPRDVVPFIAERALHAAAGFLAVAAVLDAVLATLRASLATARQRGDALARSRDRLQLEMQEKERSREQLVHAQKMEAVGRLASGLTHDFNHLLSLVLGYARRGQRSEDPARMREALMGAESAARRAMAVARRLLDFSRQEATRVEVFDAAAALREMEPMLRQLFRPGIELALALDGPATVRFDRAQLELIVLTLASNSDHAMADGGGRFTLSVRTLPGGAGDGEVVIEASDTGAGMDARALARCFEPFFTTKPSGQGTGLGLAVAQQLVQAAGGRMEVESAPGQGCTLRIRLPWRRDPE